MKRTLILLLIIAFFLSGCAMFEPVETKCDPVPGKDIYQMVRTAVGEKAVIEMTDDFYSLPSGAMLRLALRSAKYETGLTNASDSVTNTDGSHTTPFSLISTILTEKGECAGGILKLIGAVEQYQKNAVNCAWRWPVGIAVGQKCYLMIVTDTGVRFFDPDRLYEDGVGEDSITAVYF